MSQLDRLSILSRRHMLYRANKDLLPIFSGSHTQVIESYVLLLPNVFITLH